MDILAFFTNQGIPATGLTPIIRIRDVSDGSLLVTDASMTEVGDGHYKYNFAAYDAKAEYAIRCDGGVILPSSERFTYAGNENYFDDVTDAVWSISPSAYDIPASSFGQSIIALLYGDSIYVDANSTWSGTGLGQGIGAQIRPVNNIGDAVVIAQYRAIRRLLLLSSITVEADDNVGGYEVYTLGTLGTNVTLTAGASADGTRFNNLNIQGTVTNGDAILLEDSSIIGDLESFTGIMNNVAFGTDVEVSIGTWAEIIQGTGGGQPGSEATIDIGTGLLNMSQWTGNLKLTGKTGDNRTVINCNSGNIIIDSTCVSGSIQLLGVGYLEADNSGPNCNVDTEAFITNEFIADQVWDEQLDDHKSAGSTGRKLSDIGSNIILTGNANGATINTIQLDAFGSSDDGAYDPALITIVDGVGAGQTRGIFEYIGATRTCVVDRNWKTLPTTASSYVISAWPGREHVNEGLAQGGTSDTITLNALASSADDAYNNQVVFIRSGKGEDQVRVIMDYDGITKIATLEKPWQIIPDNTSAYIMLPYHIHFLEDIVNAVWSENPSGYSGEDTFGGVVNEINTNVVALSASNVLLSDDIKRLLGLTHENIFIDNPNYDSDGNLTSARVRIYSNPASVGTGSNIIGTYQISAPSSAPGQFISWQQVRTS